MLHLVQSLQGFWYHSASLDDNMCLSNPFFYFRGNRGSLNICLSIFLNLGEENKIFVKEVEYLNMETES